MTALATTTPAEVSVAQVLATEELTTREWARLLVLAGISTTETAASRVLRQRTTPSRMVRQQGGMTNVVAFSGLPAEWQQRLQAVREARQARTFTGLLTAATPTWTPPIRLTETTGYNQTKALHVREAMDVYFGLIDQGRAEKDANLKARHRFEELTGERPSPRTIYNWAKRVTAAGGHGKAPIEAYGEFKKVAHHKARLGTKLGQLIPFGVDPAAYDFAEFLKHFASLCTKEGAIIISGAHHDLEMRWQMGEAIKGLGKCIVPGAPFPFTYDQLKKLAPGYSQRKLGGQGKFRAVADGVLPTVSTTTAALQLCGEYQLDDTRCDFVVMDNVTSKPVTLKLYIVLEIATRKVVAWIVKQAGNFTSTDTAALVGFTLRHAGLAAPGAGYKTIVRVERGAVAMPDDRARLLEAMYPGQIEVVQTGMTSGALLPGAWNAEGKGQFWQKPHIEAFNKTWGLLSRQIPGQRGSDFRKQPATLGTHGVNRKAGTGELSITPGTQLAEAAITGRAAQFAAALANASDEALEAAAAARATGIAAPLLFEDEARDAIAAIIAHYNARTRHTMEGFEAAWVSFPDGSRRLQKESPDMKWSRLLGAQASRGIAPVRISPADMPVLLLRAHKVMVTPQGVTFGKRVYWQPHSTAILRAQSLATLKFEALALADPCDPAFIVLIKNRVDGHRDGAELGAPAELLEVLPLKSAPDRSDVVAVAQAGAEVRENYNAIVGGVARASEDAMSDHTKRRSESLSKLTSIFSTTFGIDAAVCESKLGEVFRKMRGKAPAPTTSDAAGKIIRLATANDEPAEDANVEPESREAQQDAAKSELTALLAELLGPSPDAQPE